MGELTERAGHSGKVVDPDEIILAPDQIKYHRQAETGDKNHSLSSSTAIFPTLLGAIIGLFLGIFLGGVIGIFAGPVGLILGMGLGAFIGLSLGASLSSFAWSLLPVWLRWTISGVFLFILFKWVSG